MISLRISTSCEHRHCQAQAAGERAQPRPAEPRCRKVRGFFFVGFSGKLRFTGKIHGDQFFFGTDPMRGRVAYTPKIQPPYPISTYDRHGSRRPRQAAWMGCPGGGSSSRLLANAERVVRSTCGVGSADEPQDTRASTWRSARSNCSSRRRRTCPGVCTELRAIAELARYPLCTRRSRDLCRTGTESPNHSTTTVLTRGAVVNAKGRPTGCKLCYACQTSDL